MEAVTLDLAGTREFQETQVRQGARAVQDAGGGIREIGAADAVRALFEARVAGQAFGRGRNLDLAA